MRAILIDNIVKQLQYTIPQKYPPLIELVASIMLPNTKGDIELPTPKKVD